MGHHKWLIWTCLSEAAGEFFENMNSETLSAEIQKHYLSVVPQESVVLVCGQVNEVGDPVSTIWETLVSWVLRLNRLRFISYLHPLLLTWSWKDCKITEYLWASFSHPLRIIMVIPSREGIVRRAVAICIRHSVWHISCYVTYCWK